MDKEFRRSLSFTYLVILTCVLVFVTMSMGMLIVERSDEALKKLMKDQMLSISDTAASMIDGDTLEALGPEDEGTPEYAEVMDTLTHFRDNMNTTYIYCLRDAGDGSFTYGIDPSLENKAEFGAPAVVTDALIEASEGRSAATDLPYTNEYGRFYSSYSPVMDSDGNVAGIVAADFAAEWFDRQVKALERTTYMMGVLALFMGIALVYFITRKNRKQLRIVKGQLNELAENVDTLMIEMGAPSDERSRYEERIKSELFDEGIDSLGEVILDMTEELHEQIEVVRRQAYVDGLTGVKNKSAYLDKVSELEESAIRGEADYAVVVFDLNGLKEINDSFGHECGDLALADAARVLSEAFGKENVYRIGGDEYIAVAEHLTEEMIKDCFAVIDSATEEINSRERDYVYPLGISRGYAVYDPDTDGDYTEVFRRADFMMYDDKEAYYKRVGDRRRRNRR